MSLSSLNRWLRHVFAPSSHRLFPEDSLQRIAATIAAGEKAHTGEVMFAVEAELSPAQLWRGVTARQQALQAFAHLRAWDTAANNGVLIYLLLADRRIEIVADRGLRGKVSDEQWRAVCTQMENRLAADKAEDAVIGAVQQVSALLEQHFPQDGSVADEDELPNRPVFL